MKSKRLISLWQCHPCFCFNQLTHCIQVNGREQVWGIQGLHVQWSPSWLCQLALVGSHICFSFLAIEMEGTGLLAETLLDELSGSYDQGSEKVKALRKETCECKKEITKAMQSKILVSVSLFSPMVGEDQNCALVVATECLSQSAVGIVERITVWVASLLSGRPIPLHALWKAQEIWQK